MAEELGVDPADQIAGYNACVFVEGPDDIDFFTTVARKLKAAGVVKSEFEDRRIGFIPFGGDNLKHWIDLEAMRKLNRSFGVIVDSDRKQPSHRVPQRKVNWKTKCEEQGGKFFILRKRTMENYLHYEAIKRSGRDEKPFDDFTNMKELFGDAVYAVIHEMTAEEVLQKDCYSEGNVAHNELKEMIESLLSMATAAPIT